MDLLYLGAITLLVFLAAGLASFCDRLGERK